MRQKVRGLRDPDGESERRCSVCLTRTVGLVLGRDTLERLCRACQGRIGSFSTLPIDVTSGRLPLALRGSLRIEVVLSAWRQHAGTAMELASLSSVNSSHSSAALRCESMMMAFHEPQHAHDPHRRVWSNASRSDEYSARALSCRRSGEAAIEARYPGLPRSARQGLPVMLATPRHRTEP